MKYLSLFVIVIAFLLVACNVEKQIQKTTLKTTEDSLSYALGISVTTNLKSQGIVGLNEIALAKAIQDVYKENKLLLDADSAQSFIMQYFTREEAKKYEEVKKEGEDFLKTNKTKEGVVTLASGVQYKIIEKGSGAIPKASDKVTTHYHGTLVDGTVFDSSFERGEPVSFPVGGVIPGWQEVLQLMPVGSTWEVYIPYDKAYGVNGASGVIPPFAALIFKIKLISID